MVIGQLEVFDGLLYNNGMKETNILFNDQFFHDGNWIRIYLSLKILFDRPHITDNIV